MSDTLQWIIVGVVIAIAIGEMIRRTFFCRRGGCDSCSLNDNCKKKDIKQNKR